MTKDRRFDRRTLISLGLVGGVGATLTGRQLISAAIPTLGGGASATQRAVRMSLDDDLPPEPAEPGPPSAPPPAPPPPPARWSDVGTWGGSVPSSGDQVTVRRPILLDVDAAVGGLTIAAGGQLVFDRERSCTLTSSGNVVVQGVLSMRPDDASVQHRLRFVGINESRFVGGGMAVLDSDVGLWCVGAGRLDLVGTTKTAWARCAQDVAAGADTIQLAGAPTGWQVGDELAIVPSGSNDYRAYDYARIRSISGTTVQLDTRTEHSHPVITARNDFRIGPEVLNLTRNVSVEGTEQGRTHILIMSSVPQHMSYFTSRWVAPRQDATEFTESVTGRYGLHIHMVGNASRGSAIVGAVVRDAGGHAFVAHLSHGVSFVSCISHDTYDEAYWWDPRSSRDDDGPPTDDVVYQSCVASLAKCDPPFRGYANAGFELGTGSRNQAVDCVAVGVWGNSTASGFKWPEGSHSVWTFNRCISHNNQCHGIFVWQNSANAHVIQNFVCAHNGEAGISHGAYRNRYQYINGFLVANGDGALHLHATSSSAQLTFDRLHCDSRGTADNAITVQRHSLPPQNETRFTNCSFLGQNHHALSLTEGRSGMPDWIELVNCTSDSTLLWLGNNVEDDSYIRIQNGNNATQAVPIGTTTQGQTRTDWNARTYNIAPFATTPTRTPQPFTLSASAPTGG